ncbi:MAG: hypothetical protein ACK58L_11695 [Planctomycetota bacterium]
MRESDKVLQLCQQQSEFSGNRCRVGPVDIMGPHGKWLVVGTPKSR